MSDYLDKLRNIKLYGKPIEEKKVYYLPKKSAKKIISEKNLKEAGGDLVMDKFYEDTRKKMIGVCLLCGEQSEKHNDKTYRNSIAHLFAKRKKQFPSIATHPANWIELCFWNNSCHTQFDTHMITFEDIKNNFPKAWEVIIEKSKILYPVMTAEEKNKVPEIILQEIL